MHGNGQLPALPARCPRHMVPTECRSVGPNTTAENGGARAWYVDEQHAIIGIIGHDRVKIAERDQRSVAVETCGQERAVGWHRGQAVVAEEIKPSIRGHQHPRSSLCVLCSRYTCDLRGIAKRERPGRLRGHQLVASEICPVCIGRCRLIDHQVKPGSGGRVVPETRPSQFGIHIRPRPPCWSFLTVSRHQTLGEDVHQRGAHPG